MKGKTVMSNNHVMGLTHITLKCNDFNEMCSFYRDTVGLEQVFTLPYTGEMAKNYQDQGIREGDTWLAYFKVADRQFVELFNQKYSTKYHIPEYSFMHFCLLVEDIVEAARHFEGKGVKLWKGPKYAKNPYGDEPYEKQNLQCGSYAFYIQDPEGNEIEVMQYSEKSMQVTCDLENE